MGTRTQYASDVKTPAKPVTPASTSIERSWTPGRVCTRTVQDALAPIAQHVSQIILLEEKARILGAPLPNITKNAEAIRAASRNLVGVAKTAMQRGDDTLKQQMPVACEQLDGASKLLLDAVINIASAPTSTTARDLLIKACRALLAAVTRILLTQDDQEIRRLVSRGEIVIEHLSGLKAVATLADLLIALRAASEALISLALASEARSEELLNASLRTRLIAANEQLRKSSPLLVSALRTYVENSTNDQAKGSRDFAIGQLLSAAHEIIMIATSTDELEDQHRPGESAGKLALSIDHARNQLWGHMRVVNMAELRENLDDIIQNSLNIVGELTDQKRIDAVEQQAEAIRSTMEGLQQDMSSDDLDQRVVGLRQMLDTFDRSVKDAIVTDMSDALIAVQSPSASSRLIDVCTSAAAAPTEAFGEIDNFKASSKRVAHAASHVATASLDSKRVKLVESTAQQLDSCTNQLVNAAQLILRNPGSRSAQDHLLLLKSHWDHRIEVLKAAVAGMTSPDSVVSMTIESINGYIALALNAVASGNIDVINTSMSSIAHRLDQIVAVAVAEIENSEDAAFRASIETALEKIRSYGPQVITALRKATQGAPAERITQSLQGSCTALSGALQELHTAIDCISEHAQEDEDTEDAGDVTILDGITEQADEALEPMVAAARQLQAEASKWSRRDNSVIALARQMASQMATMAATARNNSEESRTQLINLANSIADNSREMVQHARLASDACTDKRMKSDLRFLCDRIPTIAVQLKIIAAVKASSVSAEAGDAEVMLVKNAQNLMDTVERTVRACEIASLKQRDSNIRWRRVHRVAARSATEQGALCFS